MHSVSNPQNRRNDDISVNMAPMKKTHKIAFLYFLILKKSCFMNFSPRSHIYRDIAVPAILRVGDTVHKVGETVPQLGDKCASTKNRNCSGF